MSYEKISCRIAVQICVGRLPSGRKSHRTFSLKHVRPDVSWEAIMGIIRALAPILAYPITKVTKVTKIVLFSEEDTNVATPAQQVNAAPDTVEPVPEEGRIIPLVFPVTEPLAAHWAISCGTAKSSSFALSRASGQKSFMAGRAPPARSHIEIRQGGRGIIWKPSPMSGRQLRKEAGKPAAFPQTPRPPNISSARIPRHSGPG